MQFRDEINNILYAIRNKYYNSYEDEQVEESCKKLLKELYDEINNIEITDTQDETFKYYKGPNLFKIEKYTNKYRISVNDDDFLVNGKMLISLYFWLSDEALQLNNDKSNPENEESKHDAESITPKTRTVS